MKSIVRIALKPTGLIWIICHVLMFLLGLFLLSAPSQSYFGSTFASGVGGSLIATGAAGVVLFLYVISNESLKDRIDSFARAGLFDVFPHRSVLMKEQYSRRLHSAKQVDLIGFGLSAFRQDYARDFAAWSQRANVRILLIDPNFPSARHSIANLRDLEEGHTLGQTKQEVEEFEKVVRETTDLRNESFAVRRMKALPSVNLFRIDNEIFWGPYLMNQQSRNTPTMIVSRGGYLFSALEEHFEALWAKSAPQ
jgi:hypothetical protein